MWIPTGNKLTVCERRKGSDSGVRKRQEMLEIRLATPDQFEEIWSMFQEAVESGESYPYPPGTTLEEGRSYWFAPRARVYIAYIDGVAVATRYIIPNKCGLGSHVANTGVIIDSSYRGRGLGKQMMEFALSEAKALGYRALQLNLVVAENKASLTICKQYGFEEVGRLPGAFHWKQERYVDALVLYREL